MPTKSTLLFPLSPKLMYSLDTTRAWLKNHLRSQVMCREQQESINQNLSMPPSYKIKNESESEQMSHHWS
jgi:hypothetical protein